MPFTVLTTKLCMVIQKYFSITNSVVYYKWLIIGKLENISSHNTLQLPQHPVAICELYKDIMETSLRCIHAYLVLSHYHIQTEIMAQIQCMSTPSQTYFYNSTVTRKHCWVFLHYNGYSSYIQPHGKVLHSTYRAYA